MEKDFERKPTQEEIEWYKQWNDWSGNFYETVPAPECNRFTIGRDINHALVEYGMAKCGPVFTLQCKECKGNQFHVGDHEKCVAIMCVNCGWQQFVHED